MSRGWSCLRLRWRNLHNHHPSVRDVQLEERRVSYLSSSWCLTFLTSLLFFLCYLVKVDILHCCLVPVAPPPASDWPVLLCHRWVGQKIWLGVWRCCRSELPQSRCHSDGLRAESWRLIIKRRRINVRFCWWWWINSKDRRMQDDPLSETQRPAQRGSEYSCWAWQHPGRYYKHVDHLADVITDVSDISLSQEPTD